MKPATLGLAPAILALSLLSTAVSAQGFGPRQFLNDAVFPLTCCHKADLDGDGDPDILVGSGPGQIDWFENLGAGNFSPSQSIVSNGGSLTWLETADIDGDGKLDVLCTRNNRVHWFRNLGSNQFDAGELIIGALLGTSFVNAADLDGDVIVSAPQGDKVMWFANDGTGVFGPQQVFSGTTDWPNGFDDGDLDVVVATVLGGEILWWQNQGAGTFATAVIISVDGGLGLDAADVDGDGDLDLVTGTSNSIVWFKLRADGTFSTAKTIQVTGTSGTAVAFADLDQDGDPDVIGGNGLGCDIMVNHNLFDPRTDVRKVP